MEKLLMVAAGGAVGASMRFLASTWIARLFGAGYMGTLLVNVVGSFAMGVLAVMLIERAPGAWQRWAPFIITGVLGGFTTFSAFSLDALYLVERGKLVVAAFYVVGSVVVSILALLLGLAIMRSTT